MFTAFFWGLLSAGALLVGAVVAYSADLSKRTVAIIMALGGGVLFGSVSFELIDEALQSANVAAVGALALAGALTFNAANWWLQRRGGGDRKDSSGAQADGSPMAIVVGSVIDGIPESFVLGLTVLQGAVSIPLFVGIVLSNFPEGLSSSAGLRVAGWPRRRVLWMWTVVVLVSAVCAVLGYLLLDPSMGRTGALVQSFAAGGLLAMVTSTLLPEAYEEEGLFTGSLVVIGFTASLLLSAI